MMHLQNVFKVVCVVQPGNLSLSVLSRAHECTFPSLLHLDTDAVECTSPPANSWSRRKNVSPTKFKYFPNAAEASTVHLSPNSQKTGKLRRSSKLRGRSRLVELCRRRCESTRGRSNAQYVFLYLCALCVLLPLCLCNGIYAGCSPPPGSPLLFYPAFTFCLTISPFFFLSSSSIISASSFPKNSQHMYTQLIIPNEALFRL